MYYAIHSLCVLLLQGSTLVVAEHEGGFIKPPSLSALAAATCLPDPYSSVSVLLAGSGPSLHQAASHAASCHPSISKVTQFFLKLCNYDFF